MSMAENQYSRDYKNGESDDRDEDPLAELARIVGYDVDAEDSQDQQNEVDLEVDLEEELMRELDAGDDQATGHRVDDAAVARTAIDHEIEISDDFDFGDLSGEFESATDENNSNEPEVDSSLPDAPSVDDDALASLDEAADAERTDDEGVSDTPVIDFDAFYSTFSLSGEAETEEPVSDEAPTSDIVELEDQEQKPADEPNPFDLDALFAQSIEDEDAPQEKSPGAELTEEPEADFESLSLEDLHAEIEKTASDDKQSDDVTPDAVGAVAEEIKGEAETLPDQPAALHPFADSTDLPPLDFDALFEGDITENDFEPESELDLEGIDFSDPDEDAQHSETAESEAFQEHNTGSQGAKNDMNRPPSNDGPGKEPKNEQWPNARQETDETALSLEAELQAAFDALEGKSGSEQSPADPYRPEQAMYPSPDPYGDHEGDAEFTATLAELDNASRSEDGPYSEEAIASPDDDHAAPMEEDPIRPFQSYATPKPLATPDADSSAEYDNPVDEAADEQGLDLGDLLAAEIGEVESSVGSDETDYDQSPFDAGDIVEDDMAPDDMGVIEVPEYEEEETAATVPLDEDLNLSLEDELAAISVDVDASSYSASASDDRSEEPYDESEFLSEYADPAVAAEVAAHANALSHEFSDQSTHYEQEAPDWTDEPIEEFSEGDDFEDDDYPQQGYAATARYAEEDLDPEFAMDEFPELDEIRSESGRSKLVYGGVAVVALLLVGGAGFYWWDSSLQSSGQGEPPVIAASSDPVKIKPADPGGKTVPNQDLAVYDRVAGDGAETPTQENLVSTEEEPIDVVQRTLNPESLPLEGRSGVAEPVGSSAKSEDRLTANSMNPDPAAAADESYGVAPKRVRTLIVKPDGTIVSREQEPNAERSAFANDASTSGEDLPVSSSARLSVQETGETSAAQEPLPGSSAASGQQAAASALPPIDENIRNSGEIPLPAARPASTAATTSANQSQTQLASATTTRAAETANADGAGTNLRSSIQAPVPTSRPAEQPVDIVEAVTDRGNLAGSSQTASAGGYSVQISSQASEDAARADYNRQAQQYASVLGGRNAQIVRADIEGRGVFYRVRIPAGSKEEATRLCDSLKNAGGNCFVAR
ncbi:SPOR domain-containing protein [Hoeflea sp. WL0058]|uniref:SPOR domain-containing protein n=1 Tax=Flavimaribacter sediminis TaxID=2865987 RepID=A0AAE2ZMD0_9HYPH|nr:SPOR domain-containing protein [Flavimaribacter sediminis]MBW8637150.1 SPOR domain-containing protein [Flavimaribacter sediminis]